MADENRPQMSRRAYERLTRDGKDIEAEIAASTGWRPTLQLAAYRLLHPVVSKRGPRRG